MKKRLKLKINGESPRSLFLAFVLAKIKCDVYLYDFLINTNTNNDDEIFCFSNFSKNLLIKFDVWDEFEDVSHGLTSLILKDNLLYEQLLLPTGKYSERYSNIFFWTAKYSDIKSLLINKLITFDNVHFVSKNQFIDEALIFDYQFNFNSFDKNLKLFKYRFSNLKKIEDQILIFYVYLRGNVEKRMYEINTADGLLILIPIKKNFYQIVWNNASNKIKERSLYSKSYFLDNLTTLLPNQIKVDEIIGDINYLNSQNISLNYLVKNKIIYFNENKFKSNIFQSYNFDFFIEKFIHVYNILENNDAKFSPIYNKFVFKYFLRKYVLLKINLSSFNSLISLFILNNIFSLPFRKLLFTLFKRVNLLGILIAKDRFKPNINNLIK